MTASLKSNSSEYLKHALLRLRKSGDQATKQDHDKIMATAAATEPAKLKLPKSTQTKAFALGGSLKGTPDALAYDKHSQELARQQSVEEQPGGARKATGKLDPGQPSWKSGKGRPEEGCDH